MITKIRVKNFKCFKDSGDIEIKPLTIFLGPNSSGKSSLLQMLLMLKQTVESTDSESPLATNGLLVEMGSYLDFVHGGNHKLPLNLEIEFHNRERFLSSSADNTRYKLSLEFTYNRKTTQVELKEERIQISTLGFQRLYRQGAQKRYAIELHSLDDEVTRNLRGVYPRKFYGAFPTMAAFKKLRDDSDFTKLSELLWSPTMAIESEFKQIAYLGPLRESPRRHYIMGGQTPSDVGTSGERAVDVLWLSHRSDSNRVKRIESKMSFWFEKMKIGAFVRLDRLSKGNFYRVMVKDCHTGLEINLSDIGFGASQVLPIIVESYYASPDSLVLVEQPEIHLHPKAQAEIGDMFIDAIGKSTRRFIIETHSEYLLARVRRRIADGTFDADNVAVYYFEPGIDGTRIRPLLLTADGQFSDIHEGFFEEGLREAFEHAKALMARHRKD